jgi:hypothetical protein
MHVLASVANNGGDAKAQGDGRRGKTWLLFIDSIAIVQGFHLVVSAQCQSSRLGCSVHLSWIWTASFPT